MRDAQRVIKLACITLAMLFGVLIMAGPAAAQQNPAPKKRYVSPQASKKPAKQTRVRKEHDDGRDYLRDPDTLPVGSTAWWRAMDYRHRGGFGDTH